MFNHPMKCGQSGRFVPSCSTKLSLTVMLLPFTAIRASEAPSHLFLVMMALAGPGMKSPEGSLVADTLIVAGSVGIDVEWKTLSAM